MMPLGAAMSVASTLALPTVTLLPTTVTLRLEPSALLSWVLVTTCEAGTLPATTWFSRIFLSSSVSEAMTARVLSSSLANASLVGAKMVYSPVIRVSSSPASLRKFASVLKRSSAAITS